MSRQGKSGLLSPSAKLVAGRVVRGLLVAAVSALATGAASSQIMFASTRGLERCKLSTAAELDHDEDVGVLAGESSECVEDRGPLVEARPQHPPILLTTLTGSMGTSPDSGNVLVGRSHIGRTSSARRVNTFAKGNLLRRVVQ